MAAANNFKPFGIGSGANVTAQADYEALAALISGFQSGKASSAQINKALRQGTVMASVLAQFIANTSGQDVLDNGDTETILLNFLAGLEANNATNFLSIDNNFSEIVAEGPTAVEAALLNLGGAPLASPTFTGTPAAPTASKSTNSTQLATTAFVNSVNAGVVGTSRNAKMSISTASATATFTADELVVQTALGGLQYKLSSVSKTVNLASSGAGGMDTGTVPAAGYVALYVIYNPTSGASALLAVNATSAIAPEVYGGTSMPADYTASALVSVWGTASSQFVVGHQIGRRINIISYTTFNTTGSQLAYGAMSLALCVPPNARKADMQLVVSQTTPNTAVQSYLASTAEGVGAIYCNASATSGNASVTSTSSGYKDFDIIGTQTLYFKMANSVAATYTFICGGYTI